MAAALERKKKIARVLGKAAPSLSEYLTVDNPFLLELVARDVITNGNKETIRAISTMADKVEELLNILRSSAKAYDGFMEVLKCDKTMDLYDLMKEFEDKEGLRKDDKPKPSPYVPHEDRHVPHQDRHDGPTPALDQDDDDDIEPDAYGLYTWRHIKRAPQPTPHQRNNNLCYTSMVECPKTGLAYILNISETRKGSEEDYKNMLHLFEELGYETVGYVNLTAGEICATIEDFVGRFTNEHASSVVVLMSHGSEGCIFGADGEPVQLNDIFNKFKKRGPLSGNPKLFFIQACRGDKETGGKVQPAAGSVEPDFRPVEVPLDADTYRAFATTGGYFALRDIIHGSWFVNAIVEVFLANGHKYSLDQLMHQVNFQVTKKIAKVHGKEARQVAEVHKTTCKDIYFHPK